MRYVLIFLALAGCTNAELGRTARGAGEVGLFVAEAAVWSAALAIR